jgi:hypothetical protein
VPAVAGAPAAVWLKSTFVCWLSPQALAQSAAAAPLLGLLQHLAR